MSMSCETCLTLEQANFLENLCHHVIDFSIRLEQDSSDDVTDYVLLQLQQVAHHLSRIPASMPRNVFEDVQSLLGDVTAILAEAEQT